MSPRVKLSDIIDIISFLTYNTAYYLDRENGRLLPVSKEQLLATKEDGGSGDYTEWQKQQIELELDILSDEKEEKYIEIPHKFLSHEFSTMENFCLSLKDQKISKPLCQAILGAGAFNRFNNFIHRYGVADDWYKYRYNAMKKIVADWCEEKDIEYEDQ